MSVATVIEPEQTLLLAADTPSGLADLLDRPDADVRDLPPGAATGARLGVVDPTPRRLATARKVVARGRPMRGRDDVWFSPDPLLRAGGVAFVFPGLEAEFSPRVGGLAGFVGVPEPALDTHTVGRHGAAVMAVGRLVDAALRRIGVRPDAVAGHSVGEWTAMIAGGIVAGPDFDAMLTHTDLDALRVPGVAFAVLGCPVGRVDLSGTDLVVSHENSTNQTVVCGPSEQIDTLVERMRAAAVICQVLPFRSGFHTPMLAPYLGEFSSGVPSLRMRSPAIPVWSATTARPFPADEEAARELCVRHLVERVRFRETVLAMHESGIRAFVQAGPGQLGSLIDDTLRELDHLTVVANSAHRSGADQLRRVAVALWSEGGAPDFTALAPGGPPVVATPLADRLPVDRSFVTDNLPAGSRSGRSMAGSLPADAVSWPSTAGDSPGGDLPRSSAAGNPLANDLPRQYTTGSQPTGDRRSATDTTSADNLSRPFATGYPPAHDPSRLSAADNPPASDPHRQPAAEIPLADLRSLATRYPAVRELEALIADTAAAVDAVLAAAIHPIGDAGTPDFCGQPTSAPPALSPPSDRLDRGRPPGLGGGCSGGGCGLLHVSTVDMPYLLDHCFAKQRDGWADETDLRPVVPATTVVHHIVEAARAHAPGRVVVGLDDVRFLRWLVAAPAVDVPVDVRQVWPDRLSVRLGDYADGTVILADVHPHGPAPWPADGATPRLSARELYHQRWLFHGPTYQGITRTTAITDHSAHAEITIPTAPGALLDNVGQVIGHWLVEHHPQRWIAFPVAIDRIRFHAPPPATGSTVDCAVRITDIDADRVRADAQVVRDGVVVVSVSGWTDTRFDSDPATGSVHRFPETSTLSWRADGGWWAVAERWPGLASREFYLRKYLCAAERADYERCAPTARRRWLLRRIVVKDAVRGSLWDGGYGPLFPAELLVADGEDGACVVSGVGGLDIGQIDVSVDSSHELGVAIVGGRIAIAPHEPQLAAAASTGGGLVVSAGAARVDLVSNPDGLPPRQYVVAWIPGSPKEEAP